MTKLEEAGEAHYGLSVHGTTCVSAGTVCSHSCGLGLVHVADLVLDLVLVIGHVGPVGHLVPGQVDLVHVTEPVGVHVEGIWPPLKNQNKNQ